MARPNRFGLPIDRIAVTFYATHATWHTGLMELIDLSGEDAATYCRRVLRNHVQSQQRRLLRVQKTQRRK